MAGRVIVLVAAVLVAVLGALLVLFYAQNTIEDARSQLEPVDVLVAGEAIPAGTTVAEATTGGLLVSQSRPTDALPEGYLVDTEDVRDLVIATAMVRNDVLALDRLADPDASEELQIGPQEMAVTIALDDPNRGAAFVEPGDRVAVFVTTTRTPLDAEGEEVGPGLDTTQLLVPEVRVVGVGSRTAPDVAQSDDTSRALVTVSVLQADAERLILGQSQGELYLGLLTEGEDGSVVTRSNGVNEDLLLQGSP